MSKTKILSEIIELMNIPYTMRKQRKVEYAISVLIKLNLSQKHNMWKMK